MTRSQLGAPGLLARHLVGGGGVSLLLPVIVAISVLAIAIAPRALAETATAEIRHELARHSPLLLDLSGSGQLGIPIQSTDPGVQFLVGTSGTAIEAIRDRLPEPLLGLTDPALWVARTNAVDAGPPSPAITTSVNLALDLRWQERIHIISGTPPAPWPKVGPNEDAGPIQVAMSRASADAMGVEVGDEMSYRPANLLLTAIYEPLDSADPYWLHVSDLATPLVEFPPGRLPIVRAGVYVSPDSVGALAMEFGVGRLTAWIPIDPTVITHDDAEDVQGQVSQLLTRSDRLPFGGELNFRSGLADVIERATARVAAMSALLALSVSGLAGVLIAVLALGVRSVLARRAPTLRLAASRGAGELQLRGAMMLEGLVLSVPAGLIGIAIAAIVLPVNVHPVAWALPAAVALVPVVLFGALTSARPTARRRSDLSSRAASRARPIAELATVGLAVLALVLLARRGLVAPSTTVGIDPLLSATPLLLAVAAGLGAVRLFPVAMRAVQRSVRRRGDAAIVFGTARAIRDPALGFATALALIVGVSIVVFSTVMAGTVRSGLIDGAFDRVGADVRVQAVAIDTAALEDVRAIPGVGSAVALSTTANVPFVEGTDDRATIVVVADTAALHAVRPDIPVLRDTGDRVSILISSDWGNRATGPDVELGMAPVVVAGVIDSFALPGLTRQWVLVDAAAAERLAVELEAASTVLVRVVPGAEPSLVAELAAQRVTASQPETLRGVVTATDITTVLEQSRSPVVEGLEAALLIAAIASLALMMATIVLATAAAAASRNRLIGILRVIGMSGPQLRRVQAWELGPLAITAIAVGTALGLALPVLVTAVLDLRPFVGGIAIPRAVLDPIPVLLALAAFGFVVVVAALVALAVGRRLAPAGLLKMGDS